MLPDPWQGLLHSADIMIWVPIMLPPRWQVLVHPVAIIVWVPITLLPCSKYWFTQATIANKQKTSCLRQHLHSH